MNDGVGGAALAEVELMPVSRGPLPVLEQRLVNCPGCGLVSAVHLDGLSGEVVRFVCPTSCAVDLATVAALVAPEPEALIA